MDTTAFNGRLLAGERIRWTGQPKQGLLFSAWDIYLVPFSVLWTTMAAFGVGSGLFARSDPPLFFVLFATVFLGFGAYFTVGRFFHDAWLRSRMRYALTDRRALILQGDGLTVVDLHKLETVELKGGAERGTIKLGRSAGMMSWFGRQRGMGPWLASQSDTPQFLAIENAQSVFNQIEQIRARQP